MSTPLGHIDEMDRDKLPKGAVICGMSGLVFKSDADYKAHTSPVTGFKPTDPQHFGKRFLLQSKKAAERGSKKGKLSKKQAKEFDQLERDIDANEVDSKLAGAKVKVKRRKR